MPKALYKVGDRVLVRKPIHNSWLEPVWNKDMDGYHNTIQTIGHTELVKRNSVRFCRTANTKHPRNFDFWFSCNWLIHASELTDVIYGE